MKKVLLFASAIALLASCAKTELGGDASATKAKGISLEVSQEKTKGEWVVGDDELIKGAFWYAEKDRLTIIGKGAKLNSTMVNDYAVAHIANYKATTSQANGKFTGTANNHTWEFDYTKVNGEYTSKANFFVVWPETDKFITTNATKPLVILPVLDQQVQMTAEGGETMKNIFMVATIKDAKPKADYSSVGETINIDLKRPFTAATFKTKNYDKAFGFIQSVTLKSEGIGGDATKVSPINYTVDPATATATPTYYNLTATDKDPVLVNADGTEYTLPGNAANSTLTLTFDPSGYSITPAGIAWEDGKLAYMAMNKVKRTGTEKYTCTYKFKNIELTKQFETAKNWPDKEGAFIGKDLVLDFDAYSYLLTNESAPGADDRTLIINEAGALTGKYNVANATIEWNGIQIDVSEIKTIIAKVALSKTELDLFGDDTKFIALEELTLNENTEVNGKFGQEFTKINLPKAKTIAANAFVAQNTLVDLNLASYEFPNTGLGFATLFTTANKTTLVTLNIASVAKLDNSFPGAGIKLADYTALKELTLKEGVQLGAGMFKGCTSLESVIGGVNLIGSSVFDGCLKLEDVTVLSATIPDYSFKNCDALVKLNNASASIVEVAQGAFEDCLLFTGLNNWNSLETIGKDAFKGCVAIKGVKEIVGGGDKYVLRIPLVSTLANSAFDGCTGLTYVGFDNVNTIGTNVFNGCTITEFEFKTAFTASEKIMDATTFGTITNTIIFVNKNQTDRTSTTLKLGEPKVTFTFGAVEVKY